MLYIGKGVRQVEFFSTEENIFDLTRGDSPNITSDMLVHEGVMQSLSSQFVQTSWAVGSRKLYHGWVLIWLSFCCMLDACVLPADTSALGRFITAMSTMYASSTLYVAISAIIGWHALNDLPNPVRASPRLMRMWTAARRVNGTGVKRKKAVCDDRFVAGYFRLYLAQPSKGLVDIRSMAWFLVGWEAGLRVSEVCNLTVCNWLRTGKGDVELKVVQTKNNRWLSLTADRAYLKKAVTEWHMLPSAVRFIEEQWLPMLASMGIIQHTWFVDLGSVGQIRREGCRFGSESTFECDVCPRLFPTFPRGRECGTMSKAHIAERVKVVARALGMDPTLFSGISFRRGGVSVAAQQKVEIELRMKQFRWLSEVTPHEYTDMGEVERAKVGAALHKAVAGQLKKVGPSRVEVEDVPCMRCAGTDSIEPNFFVLCDGCPLGMHLQCMQPPRRSVPTGDWFCPNCVCAGNSRLAT